MKSTKYIVSGLAFAALASSMTFAQILDPSITGGGQETLASGEVTVPTTPKPATGTTPVLNAAPDGNMSGEININIPYNPSENEIDEPYFNSAPEQQYTLNSATNVPTGPALNMFIALMLSLIISGVIYTRAKPFMK